MAEAPLKGLTGDAAWRRLWPFAAVAVLGVASLAVPPRPDYVVEASVALALVAATLFLPFRRLPSWVQAVPPLAFFAPLALLRGPVGEATGFGILAMLPVLWLALYGSRRQLGLALGALALVYVVPAIYDDTPLDLAMAWRRAVLWILVTALVGVTVRRLVTSLAERERALATLAATDPLTGLLNRRACDERLSQEMSRSTRDGTTLTVAVLDLDRFKAFNDTYGHQAGDELLAGFATGASRVLRQVDLFARWGGEEFVLALPGCDALAAPKVLERVRDSVPGGQTCSVGFAQWDGGESIESVLARADGAMYAAKLGGRDRMVAAAVRGGTMEAHEPTSARLQQPAR